jgi:fructosamine-3-kinase
MTSRDADSQDANQIAHAVVTALGGSQREVTVADWTELDGGQVGRVLRIDLETNDGEANDGEANDVDTEATAAEHDTAIPETVVAKTGDTPLTVEARMLEVLADAGLAVPSVYYASDALLVLEHVAGETPSDLAPDVQRDTARHLAALHDTAPADIPPADTAPANIAPANTTHHDTAPDSTNANGHYGFPFDTLSGPYHQPNPWTADWPTFFREYRLEHVANAARDEGKLTPDLATRVAELCADLDELLPQDPDAALLHGDVWRENLLVADGEITAFLDPACSFGHAEVDLAYADWVGFGEPFFDAYDTARGIAPEFRDHRRDVYVCYPLLEHIRYFDADRYREQLSTTLTELGY